MRHEGKLDVKRLKQFLVDTHPISDALNMYLGQIGLKRGQLAEAVNVTSSAVSLWLSDERFPDGGTIYHIGVQLGLDENQMVNLLRAKLCDSMFKDVLKFIERSEIDGKGEIACGIASLAIRGVAWTSEEE